MIDAIISLLSNNQTSKTALKHIAIGGFLSIIVRLCGFIKESTVAYFFGISEYVDFYVLGLVFVSFFVQPVGGALATLLTQKYIQTSEYISQEISKYIYLKCLLFGIFCIFIILFFQGLLLKFPLIESWFLSRFNNVSLNYIYILLPIGFFSLMSVINGSILMATGKFKTYTLLPILVHISTITFLVFSSKNFIFEALLIGTLVGFLLELLISKFCIKELLIKLNFDLIKQKNREFSKIIKSMPNMILSGTIMGGCLVVDQVMALLAGNGAVAMINFGNKVPLGLISLIAIIWTVLYPNFIKYAAASDYISLRKYLFRFCILSFFILLPTCGTLSFFSQEIISILFEHGAFINKNTIIVSSIQSLYLLYIPLYVISMICIRVINALENTRIF